MPVNLVEKKKKKVKNEKYEVVTCTVHVVKIEHNTNKTTQSKLRCTLKDLSWAPNPLMPQQNQKISKYILHWSRILIFRKRLVRDCRKKKIKRSFLNQKL